MELTEFFLRVGVALLLGSLIGVERQMRQRMAGLRTNALVAIGAALFVSLGTMTPDEVSPTRVASQVVSGIGFLGAGVIFKEGLNVSGLNTAATIWAAGAVGVLSGSGYLVEATIGTSLILLAHVGLRPIAGWIDNRPRSAFDVEFHYRLKTVIKATDEIQIRSLLLNEVRKRSDLHLQSLKSEDLDDPAFMLVQTEISMKGKRDELIETIADRLAMEPTVSSINWESLTESPNQEES